MGNKRRLVAKGVTKADLKDKDFLTLTELEIYLEGIGETKLRRWCNAGVFESVDGLYSRREVERRLENLSAYGDRLAVEQFEMSPKAAALFKEFNN